VTTNALVTDPVFYMITVVIDVGKLSMDFVHIHSVCSASSC